MKTHGGILVLVLTTLLGLDFRTVAMGQGAQPGARGDDSPTSKVPQPAPIFPPPPQPDPGVPQPKFPPPDPRVPQEMPMPRLARPAESMENKMVVSPNHIRLAQAALRAKGFNPGDDGQLDEETQDALKNFQKKSNLPATGVLDDKTAAKLGVDLRQEK